MNVQIEKLFSGIDLFAELTPGELARLAEKAGMRTFAKNVIVLNEGDETTTMYVILTGSVKVFASDEDGKEVLLNQLGPNDYFGEIALIDGGPRSASIMTIEATRVATITRDVLLERIHANPAVAVALLKNLGQKLRQQTLSTKHLALMDVYQRLVKVLYELASETDGQVIVEGVSHKELADRVFASREMVTLIVKELRLGGYVEADRKRIVIRKKLPAKW